MMIYLRFNELYSRSIIPQLLTLYIYRQDLPEGQLCRYCFYSQADFWFFCPAVARYCTDQGEIWQER